MTTTLQRDPFAGMPNAGDEWNDWAAEPEATHDTALAEWAAEDELASYADVGPEDVEWLWEGYFPLACVVVIGGDSGIGKGRMLADLGSRVTRGDAMPDGSPGQMPAHVIMITPEDNPKTATVRRLITSKAERSRVHDMTVVAGNIFAIQDDLPALRRRITTINRGCRCEEKTGQKCAGVSLVILDPVSRLTTVSLASDVTVQRKVIGPLEAVAREFNLCIALVAHPTKTGAVAAARTRSAGKDAIAGSKALTNGARMVLFVSRDEAAPDIRTLAVVKSNETEDNSAPAVRYTIKGPQGGAHVEWLTSMAGGPARKSSQADACLAVLQANGGVMHGREIAATAGIDYDSARVALSRLAGEGRARDAGRGLWAAGGVKLAAVPQWAAKSRGWEGAPA